MSSATDFERAGKPDRVTILDSGSGTFTPMASSVWAEIMMVGGGGSGPGGNTNTAHGSTGGSGAQTLITRIRLTSTMDYAIAASVAGGAPGAAGLNGNNTTFGPLVALGGRGGVVQSSPSAGPAGGGYDLAGSCVVPCGDGQPGGSGGCGSAGTPGPGRGPGLYAPIALTNGAGNGGVGGAVGTTAGSYMGGSGGGSSMDGKGGAGGNANSGGTGSNGSAGSGYGSGGGAGGQGSTAGGSGGAGAGGRIIIREYAEPSS